MTVLAIAIKSFELVIERDTLRIDNVETIEDNFTGYILTTDEHIKTRFSKENWRLEIL